MNVERDQHASPPSLLTKTIPIIYLSDPSDLMQRLQEVGRKFFELPASEKESVTRPVDSQDMEGYFTEDPKHLKAWDDHLIQSIWPPSSINYKYYIGLTILQIREVTEECTRNVTKLTEKIVGYLSKGLGLRREALQECLGGDKTKYVMRINYYPPSDSVIGAPAHTDACGLALLVSNEVRC